MSETIQRKILVCAQQRCQRCQPECQVVPDDCPSRILHPLETRTGGSQTRARQTGKTTELVEMANDLAAAGYPVYYLTENESMSHHTKSRFRVHPGVRFVSWRQVDNHMRGMAPGVILADEIEAKEMDRIRRLLGGAGHLFLAHYWTPR